MSELEKDKLSDCLMGFDHPVETPHFFGHQDVIAKVEAALSGGRFHHAWLFAGPEGVGKASFAYHLARVLIGSDALSKGAGSRFSQAGGLLELSKEVRGEKAGRLIDQFAHPDMRILRRAYDEKGKKFFRNIRVDEVRALKNFLHTTPSMGPQRIVIVDAADDMNIASANALLKVLEEPPAHTCFLLISHAPGLIPITIRSRCRMLKFNALHSDEFQAAVTQQFDADGRVLPDDVNWQTLDALANGGVRSGLELMTGSGLKFYQALYKIFDHLPSLDERNVDFFVTGILKDKSGQDYESGVHLISDLISRLIKGRASSFELSQPEQKLSEKLIKTEAIDQWLGLWDTLQQQSRDVDELNLDKRTHLMSCFFSLRDLVRAG